MKTHVYLFDFAIILILCINEICKLCFTKLLYAVSFYLSRNTLFYFIWNREDHDKEDHVGQGQSPNGMRSLVGSNLNNP